MLLRRAASAVKAAKQRRHYRALVKRSAADAPKLEDLELETAPAPPKGDATALLRVRTRRLNYKDRLVLSRFEGRGQVPGGAGHQFSRYCRPGRALRPAEV